MIYAKKRRDNGTPPTIQRGGRYRHAWWSLYMPCYLLMYTLVEKAVPSNSDYWVSYLPIDDRIPFIAEFVYFYVLWYPLLFAVGLWLIFKDAAAFRRYMWSIIIGFTGSTLFCFLFPNGQNLRPEVIPGNSLAAFLVRQIHLADTNTNVLPSVHVIGSFCVLFAVLDSATVSKFWRACAAILVILINLSTVIIKQHSVLDVYIGIAVSGLLYVLVYIIIRRFQENTGTDEPVNCKKQVRDKVMS